MGLAAVYTSMAQLWNEMYGRVVLPLGTKTIRGTIAPRQHLHQSGSVGGGGYSLHGSPIGGPAEAESPIPPSVGLPAFLTQGVGSYGTSSRR